MEELSSSSTCDPNEDRDSSLDAIGESSRNFAFARLVASLFPDVSSFPAVAVLDASYECIAFDRGEVVSVLASQSDMSLIKRL